MADLVPAGVDLGSRGRLTPRRAPSRRGVPLSPGDQGAERQAHTGHRVSLALATVGRKPACPLADPQGRGTAPRSRAARSTRHRRRARSLAARRQDSSMASTRSASTRSSGTRERRRPASLVPERGSPEIRDLGTVRGSSVTVSRAKGTAAFLALGRVPPSAQATRQARASLGRGHRAGDRLATPRRPASSPARWDTGQVLLAARTRRARTRPGRCRQARSPRASSQVRLGNRRPATSLRARRRPARGPPASSLPAGQVPKRLAPARRDRAEGRPPPRDQPASRTHGTTGPVPPTARQESRAQGRVTRPTPILTGY